VLQEPATRVQDPVRFGADFELDGGRCQLRRSGRVLKLERIPMEVLLFLVQQRGELVTREQIVEKVWGKDVYLDTDNSINGAIRKIRQALRDDPEQPRFIQTITGRGYRFIAPAPNRSWCCLRGPNFQSTRILLSDSENGGGQR
jgi:DNA-binding winged helix-turn-helix (wHTH) protein